MDEGFPEKTFAVSIEEERAAIAEADDWVENRIFSMMFRAIADSYNRFSSHTNCVKYEKVMQKTSGYVPPGVPYILRPHGLVQNEANKLDRTVSFIENHAMVIREMEVRLENPAITQALIHPLCRYCSLWPICQCLRNRSSRSHASMTVHQKLKNGISIYLARWT